MTASRQEYIDQYAEIAMEQMRKYGIPASITLAQGIIESADGRSTLSRTANNHFGIKGENEGAFVLANDDKPGEKFRKYDSVSESYEDHSRVLMSERYMKYCGGLSADDYRGWAEGIKAGGYATSDSYVDTICRVIEGADLQKYDRMVMAEAEKNGNGLGNNTLTPTPSGISYSLPLRREEFLLVTSPFGNRQDPMNPGSTGFHKGIDISCEEEEEVFATEDKGRVISVIDDEGTAAGRSLTIEYMHDDGIIYQTTYSHLSSISVKTGDEVSAGDVIGISGNTGTRTTGPHLHFEVRSIAEDGTGRYMDPAAYLSQICQKEGLSQTLLHDGRNLMEKYQVTSEDETQDKKTQLDAGDWMKKLLSSEDSSVSLGAAGDPIITMAVELFSSLLVLAMQIDAKEEKEQMSSVTDAAVRKEVDLTGMIPSMKQCSVVISESGRMMLKVDNGNGMMTHSLTQEETSKLSSILSDSSLQKESKQQQIISLFSGIAIREQISSIYDQESNRQESVDRSTHMSL